MYLRSDGFQKHEGKEDFMPNDPHPQVNTRRFCVFLCTLLLESEDPGSMPIPRSGDPGSMPTPQVRRPCSKLICLTLRSSISFLILSAFMALRNNLRQVYLNLKKKLQVKYICILWNVGYGISLELPNNFGLCSNLSTEGALRKLDCSIQRPLMRDYFCSP